MAFTWRRYPPVMNMLLLNAGKQWHYRRALKTKCQFTMLILQIHVCFNRNWREREGDFEYGSFLETRHLSFQNTGRNAVRNFCETISWLRIWTLHPLRSRYFSNTHISLCISQEVEGLGRSLKYIYTYQIKKIREFIDLCNLNFRCITSFRHGCIQTLHVTRV